MFEWALAFAIFCLGILAATGWHRIKHEKELEDARIDESFKYGVLMHQRITMIDDEYNEHARRANEKYKQLVRDVQKIHQNLIHLTQYRRSTAHRIACGIVDKHRDLLK